MGTPDYTKLDSLIVAAIKRGASSFNQIDTDAVYHEAGRIAKEFRTEHFRAVDRRLQTMRRKGLIVYTNGCGWHLPVEAK